MEKNRLSLRKHRYKKGLHRRSGAGLFFSYAPGETRTPNLLIRSQMLYPIELRAHNELRTADCGHCGHCGQLDPARRSGPVLDGRYKTRTCDLHDVNVAL